MSYTEPEPNSVRALVFGWISFTLILIATALFGLLSAINLWLCWNTCYEPVQVFGVTMAVTTIVIVPAFLIWLAIALRRRRATTGLLVLTAIMDAAVVAAFVGVAVLHVMVSGR